jgi:hypothetical protein
MRRRRRVERERRGGRSCEEEGEERYAFVW